MMVLSPSADAMNAIRGGGAAAAGLGALGPIGLGLGAISGIANFFSQQQTNLDSKEIANDNRLFAREMSNTAHQREVADLKAAGLNPILSAGGGASTPQGSTPSLAAPQIAMPDIFSYGVSLKQLEQTDQRLAIDKANSAANIANTMTDTDLKKAETILKGKGMMRAELEGEGAELLRPLLKALKDSVLKPPQPTQMPSSGGELLTP